MNKIKYIICFLLFSDLLAAQTPNSWTRVADCGDTARGGAVAFSIDSFGYVVLGSLPNYNTGGYIYPTGLWQYNPYTNVWTQKASFPGQGRGDAVCFTIGSKAYIGLGDEDGAAFNDFWEYDPSTDTWTQKANFGGGGRTAAIGFSIGNMGYVGLGVSDTARATKDIWEYDPAADTWTQKNDFAGLPRSAASAFSIGSSAYVAIGYDGSYPLNGLSLNDLWQYDTDSDSWTQKANYPGKADGGAFVFTIGDIAYLGTGGDSTDKTWSDFWKYDPQADAWIEKDSFGGGTRAAAVAFSIGNKGYAGTGDITNVAYGSKDFWMYTPDSISTSITNLISFIQGVSIYPNPTQGSFTMDINTSNITNKDAQILITDLLGQSVLTRSIVLHSGNNKEEISLGESATSGIYIVQLNVDGQSLFSRIVLDK